MSSTTNSRTYGKSAVHRVHEVLVGRCAAAERRPSQVRLRTRASGARRAGGARSSSSCAAPRRRRRDRLDDCGLAPLPRSRRDRPRHSSRLATTPAIFSSAGFVTGPSTRMSNGLNTPAEMPALASAARPAIASPPPGRSFACDSLGFNCTPGIKSAATITTPIAPVKARVVRDETRPPGPETARLIASLDDPPRHYAPTVDAQGRAWQAWPSMPAPRPRG